MKENDFNHIIRMAVMESKEQPSAAFTNNLMDIIGKEAIYTTQKAKSQLIKPSKFIIPILSFCAVFILAIFTLPAGESSTFDLTQYIPQIKVPAFQLTAITGLISSKTLMICAAAAFGVLILSFIDRLIQMFHKTSMH